MDDNLKTELKTYKVKEKYIQKLSHKNIGESDLVSFTNQQLKKLFKNREERQKICEWIKDKKAAETFMSIPFYSSQSQKTEKNEKREKSNKDSSKQPDKNNNSLFLTLPTFEQEDTPNKTQNKTNKEENSDKEPEDTLEHTKHTPIKEGKLSNKPHKKRKTKRKKSSVPSLKTEETITDPFSAFQKIAFDRGHSRRKHKLEHRQGETETKIEIKTKTKTKMHFEETQKLKLKQKPEPKKEDSFGSLVDILNSDFLKTRADTQIQISATETIKKLNHLLEEIYSCLKESIGIRKIEYINERNLDLNRLKKLIDRFYRKKDEIFYFNSKLCFDKDHKRILNEFKKFSGDLLNENLNHNLVSKKHQRHFSLEVIKTCFDLYHFSSLLLAKSEEISEESLEKNFGSFSSNLSEKIIRKIPENLTNASFSNLMFNATSFFKKFCLFAVDKNYHTLYYGYFREILKKYKAKFEQIELNLAEEETIKTMSLTSSVYKLIGKEAFSSKFLLKSVYDNIRSFVIDPKTVIYSVLKTELKDMTKRLKNEIKYDGHPEENAETVYKRERKKLCSREGVCFQRKFEELSEYILTIVSSYKKIAFEGKTLNLFVQNALGLHDSYIERILYFNFHFSDDYLMYMRENSKLEKTILKKAKRKPKSIDRKREPKLSVDQLLVLCSDVSLADQALESVCELIQLESENVSKEALKTNNEISTKPSFERALILVGLKVVFEEFSEEIQKLFTREKSGDLVGFSSFSKDFDKFLKGLERKTESVIFTKVAESVFMALIVAFETKLFCGDTVFRVSEMPLLINDLTEVYAIFSKFSVDSFLENTDHVCAVKEFLRQGTLPIEEAIERHKCMCETEEYASYGEFVNLVRDNREFPPSLNYSDENESLSLTGQARFLSRVGSKKCLDYAKIESKKTEVLSIIRLPSYLLADFSKSKEISETIPPLPELANKHSAEEIVQIEEVEEKGALFAASYIQENEKLKNNVWKLSGAKPPPYSDKNFKTMIDKNRVPQCGVQGKTWRWATDWLISEADWSYSINFSVKKFKRIKPGFVHKARTRELIRYRILDSSETPIKDEKNIFEILREIVVVSAWSIYKKCLMGTLLKVKPMQKLGKSEKSLVFEVDLKSNKSNEREVGNKKDNSQGERSLERQDFDFLNDKNMAEKLIEGLSAVINSASLISGQGRIMDGKAIGKIEKIGKIFEESCQLDVKNESIERNVDELEKLKTATEEIRNIKGRNFEGVLAAKLLSSIFGVVQRVSKMDQIEPVLWIHFMQEDFDDEGMENVKKFGLPLIEIVKDIHSMSEIVLSKPFTKNFSEESLDMIKDVSEKLKIYLGGYHVIGKDTDNFEETVCRLFESFYNLCEAHNKNGGAKMDPYGQIEKIMRKSAILLIKDCRMSLPTDSSDWDKNEWENFSSQVLEIIKTEAETYQNEMLIPKLDDPCKATIRPILKETLTVCESALQKNEFSSSFLAVVKLYGKLEEFLFDWEKNEIFMKDTILEIRGLIPSVVETVKKLLKQIINGQYKIVSNWVESSKENESYLGEGRFTSFYSDVFSYLQDFSDLYIGLLLQIPPIAVTVETCEDFKVVFKQLVRKFVDLNCDKIYSVEKLLSESSALDLNRDKKDRPLKCKVSVFEFDINEFEMEETEENSYNSTEELCCRLSNLYLASERVSSIDVSVNAKIRSHTGNEEFFINLESEDLSEKISDLIKILAHKIVYLDIGDIIFESDFFGRNKESNNLEIDFSLVEKELFGSFETIRDRLQIKEKFKDTLQAIFDVFVSCFIWILLGTTEHKFKPEDVSVIREELEIFSIFKEEDNSINIQNFETEVLELILSFMKKKPENLINFHRTVKEEKFFEKKISSHLSQSSAFVLNNCTATVFHPLENRLSLKPNGLLAIIEHSNSAEAKKYLKKYLRKHREDFEEKENKVDIEAAVKGVLSEVEAIAMILSEMDEEHIKEVSMQIIQRHLDVLTSFQKEKRNDDSVDWKSILRSKKLVSEAEVSFRAIKSLCDNYHTKYKAEIHSKIVCSLLTAMARIGFLLDRIRVVSFSLENLNDCIRTSAEEKFRTVRKNYPFQITKFARKDWEDYEKEILNFLHEEMFEYGPKQSLFELRAPAGEAIKVFVGFVSEELKRLFEDQKMDRKDIECLVGALKISKQIMDYIRAYYGPEQSSVRPEAQSFVSLETYEHVCRILPSHSVQCRSILESLFQVEHDSAVKKFVSNIQKKEKGEEKDLENTSRYCELFKRTLMSFRVSLFGRLAGIPANLQPKGTDRMFFGKVESLIRELLRYNFPAGIVSEKVMGAVSAAEKDYGRKEGRFLDLFFSRLSEYVELPIDEDSECFDVKTIGRKLRNLENLNAIIPLFQIEIFHSIETLGLEWDLSGRSIISPVHLETERLLEFSARGFLLAGVGEGFFGELLRRKEGKLAGGERLAGELPLALDALSKKLDEFQFGLILHSIFKEFLKMFEWIVLESKRTFKSKEERVIKSCLTAISKAFSEINPKFLNDKDLKRTCEIVELFGNLPEENIRLFRTLERGKSLRKTFTKDHLLKVISRTDSKEARRFARLKGVRLH